MSDAMVLVACYGGKRRCTPPGYETDHSLFLRQWDDALTRTRCQADVCFVSNGDDGRAPQYRARLDVLSKKYYVVHHENVGHSQGAWAAGWRAYPGYKYYIIVEDDYIPVLAHFDQVLVDLLEEFGCDYLCQYLWAGKVPMMNGVITGRCIRKMSGFPGEACHGQVQADHEQYIMGTKMQREFGCKVRDLGGRFRVMYMMNGFLPGERAGDLGMFYPDKQDLFVPAQAYHAPGGLE